jgi:hypothetical protein
MQFFYCRFIHSGGFENKKISFMMKDNNTNTFNWKEISYLIGISLIWTSNLEIFESMKEADFLKTLWRYFLIEEPYTERKFQRNFHI